MPASLPTIGPVFRRMAWLLALPGCSFGERLVPWLEQLQTDHRAALVGKLAPELRDVRSVLGARSDDSATTDRILRPLFLHFLLTTDAPVDGSRGGVLETVYFWHWVTPNPRHALRSLPDSQPLTSKRPDPRHASYRSWADMDRTPDLFLGDLASEQARYFHPQTGPLFSFGWCSEREMAYSLLLTSMGYTTKIKFKGNHVWTEILLGGTSGTDGTKSGILVVDNTFGRVGAHVLAESEAAWLADLGPGKDVVAMNAKARSPLQRSRVDEIQVGPRAQARMSELVAKWLRPRSGAEPSD